MTYFAMMPIVPYSRTFKLYSFNKNKSCCSIFRIRNQVFASYFLLPYWPFFKKGLGPGPITLLKTYLNFTYKNLLKVKKYSSEATINRWFIEYFRKFTAKQRWNHWFSADQGLQATFLKMVSLARVLLWTYGNF